MAASASTSAFLRTNSHDTALCIIPPSDLCENIAQLRELYDKAYHKWPPHINLIYPFVALDSLPHAQEQIKACLDQNLDGDTYAVSLNDTGLFPHRSNSTIFLRESVEPKNSILTRLRLLSLQALGQEPTTHNFHLTIGQSEDNTLSSREYLLSKARLLPVLEFRFGALAILARDRTSDPQAPQQMKLWGLVPLRHSSHDVWIPSEFWTTNSLETLDPEFDIQLESSADNKSLAPVRRESQAGITYQHDPEQDVWVAHKKGEPAEVISSITVASYNVLIDSEYPHARERDPLLVETIIAETALADILVLQEVSDDFLSYLLGDSEIKRLYPFTSHAPPAQADIGPLPSLRNIVLLSRWPFDWTYVPFHRRHKGAIVATFDGLFPQQSPQKNRLVLAGVHLTCGLTDGSVAAKKIQLDNVTRYLKRHHETQPWIIAGDFNITTSTYTVETALKNKAISTHTVEVLSSIESDFSNLELLDAWSISRINATDDINTIEDDLFEGEEGGTFVPGDNLLAAAICNTSNFRPQRYDRVLVRTQDVLRIVGFSRFGLPQDIGGTQVVASDHYGIRAELQVAAGTEARSKDYYGIASQYPVEHIRAQDSLATSSDLTSTLEYHNMFPTHHEVEDRQQAFALLRQVVQGTSGDNDASLPGIPMVVVAVGSYALNVWTSSSDIDCLCIGSISSKTFFKLVRQRLLKAEPEGVRILRKVEANTGTMLELSVNGIPMDLQYCPAARIVERWPEFHKLPASDPVFNLSILSLRKLKPYRDLAYIQRTLPSGPAFRLAYRCIKLWAVQRGIYAPKFGYLGGVHISLMLTWLCKRIIHGNGSVSAADLVISFFHHYANFDWTKDMVYDAFFHKSKPRYHRSTREPMVILGYHAPNSNIAHTATVPGLQVLTRELRSAYEQLSDAKATWNTFFDSQVSTQTGVQKFLSMYATYVKVDIQFWGRTLSRGKALLGYVESRCISLIVDMHKILPDLQMRIWPARFTDNESSETTDYQGCYLIGLHGSLGDGVVALQKVFDRFLSQLNSDEKNFDPNTCWVGVSLSSSKDLTEHRLDDRDWGIFSADIESDSDDEEEEMIDEPEEIGNKQRSIPQRPKPTLAPLSTSKLRPASDVLNRLRWDPALDPADYIIGYEDRFLGAKETSLEKWKTEQTDEEFIPQHRILYFKKRAGGDRQSDIVWERATRIDKIFGSGAGAAGAVVEGSK